MPTVYLHLGMPKTGTTFIQYCLRRNNELLRSYGYDFVRTKHRFDNISYLRNAHFLVPETVDEQGNPLSEEDLKIYKYVLKRVVASARKFGNAIISDEMLWIRDNAYFKRFKKDMDKREIDLKVIVYLRRQDTFVESYWGQTVKIDNKASFEEYLEFIQVENPDYLHLNYKKRLAKFEKIFGFDNMIVRVYERGQFGGRNKNLVSDFLEAVGLGDKIDETKDFEDYDNPDAGAVNYSIGGIYIETKRLLNQNYQFRTKNNFAVEILYKIMQKDPDYNRTRTSVFTYEQRLKFLEGFAKTNKAVADKYLGGNGGSLFKDEIVDKGETPYDFSKEELVKLCSQVITHLQRKLTATEERLDRYIEAYAEKKDIIKEQNSLIKKQQKTIDWVTTPFLKKVIRKLKNMFKG